MGLLQLNLKGDETNVKFLMDFFDRDGAWMS